MRIKKTTSLPSSKAELLAKFKDAYKSLHAELYELSEIESRVSQLEGGISICDLLAYQIGWGKLLLGWEQAEQNGERPAMPAKGYKWNQLGALASLFYQTYHPYSFEQLRIEFDKLAHDLIQMIDNMREEELCLLKQRQWAGEKWPLVKWIQVNTIAPYSAARKKIRQWKKRNDNEE